MDILFGTFLGLDKACYAKVNEVLSSHGMSLDPVLAATVRDFLTEVGNIAKAALVVASEKPGEFQE